MTHPIAFPPPSTVPELALAKEVRAMFLGGEQGAWYDPSDMSTLFQDAAGTTPVTAVEQPVGRILDKSGRGNHATQTTAASRPVLSAQVNLLTETEFRNGITDAPVRGGLLTATTLAGYLGALSIGKDGSTGTFAYKSIPHAAGVTYTVSALVEMTDGLPPSWGAGGATGGASPFTLIGNGQIPSSGSEHVVRLVAGNLYRVSWTYVASGAVNNTGIVAFASNNSRTFKVTAYDLRVANTGVNLPPYQRVNTATDYDTAGFPHYLRFDGVDDFLQTNSINFTGTDKMTVFAGVRKLSDAATGMLVELSASLGANNGCFYITAPGSSATANIKLGTKGTVEANTATANSFASPVTATLSASVDVAAPLSVLRANGAVAQSSSSTLGAGAFGNYPLYIGRRAGTSHPFNGHLYQLIVRGAQSSLPQVQAGERWTNNRTGAY